MIVMPETTPIIKVEATKKFGVNVVLHGDTYDDACRKARELEAENGYVFVHPFDDIDVMLGQGTVAMEVLKELEDVDKILVPIGGGGLISGIAMAAKILKPSIRGTQRGQTYTIDKNYLSQPWIQEAETVIEI